jgi:hypothetical protein
MTSSMVMIILVPILLSFVIPITLVIALCFDLRKKIGGYWNLRQATTGIFIMFFTAYVIQYVGKDLIFAKLIEPHMVEKTEEAMIAATTTMMEKAGTEQTQIDEQEAKIRKEFDDQKTMTVGKVISGIAIAIVLMFVLALVFGAMFKKEPPLYADNAYEDPVK